MRQRRRARTRAHRRPAVLADGWYSWLGTEEGEYGWDALTTVLGATLPARVAQRVLASGPLRGLALGLLSSRYGAVAIIRHDPGWRTLLLARALMGRRRKLVVFQFFDHASVTRGDRLWRRVERRALRRSLAVAQVLTEVELRTYPKVFGITAGRFELVRFAARTAPRGAPPPVPRINGPVVAAGRAHCDWPTVFAAAAGRGWDLQVVCSARDQALVELLNVSHHVSAQISVELTRPQAHALLSRAAISVICVDDGLVGRGHVRLAEATDVGAAIVASDVVSLTGYLEAGVTAMVVPVGDADALRVTIEGLLRNPGLRASLAHNAFVAAAAWTGPDYVAALQTLASEAASRTDPSEPR